MLDLNIKLTDTTVAEKLADDLAVFIPQLRSRLDTLRENWLKNHSAWSGKYTRSFFRSDTFNHYVPALRRAVEKFVNRGAQMLVPNNEFFEVYPNDEMKDQSGKEAEGIMAYLLHLTRKRIRVYPLAKQLLRCHLLYGRSILKTHVQVINGEVWPCARVVDPFAFLVFPETVSDVDSASMLVEDTIIPFEQYESLAKRGAAQPLDRSKLHDVEWPTYVVRRLQHSGISTPDQKTGSSSSTDKKPGSFDWVALSEIWSFDGSAWRFCWLVWNHGEKPEIVKISGKFNRPAFRMVVAREIPGEQYTSSMGDDLEPTQILVNDQVNMFFEGQAMSISGPIAIDPNQMVRVSALTYRPRAKWPVAPGSVSKIDIPDISSSALKGIHFGMGLMESFGGSSPLAEGQPIRNLPRSGGAVSALLNMSLADIRDVAKSIEDDILAPMLHDLVALTVRFVPKTQVFKIPGTESFPARRMTVKDLEGDWDFNWVGSIQSKDLQDRAERYMSFLGVLAKMAPFVIADMASRNKRFNWTAVFKRIWRYGLGERGVDTLIEDVPADTPRPVLPQNMNQTGTEVNPEIEQMLADLQQQMGNGGGLPPNDGSLPDMEGAGG